MSLDKRPVTDYKLVRVCDICLKEQEKGEMPYELVICSPSYTYANWDLCSIKCLKEAKERIRKHVISACSPAHKIEENKD